MESLKLVHLDKLVTLFLSNSLISKFGNGHNLRYNMGFSCIYFCKLNLSECNQNKRKPDSKNTNNLNENNFQKYGGGYVIGY